MGLRNRSKFADYQIRFVTTTCKDWLVLLNSAEVMQIISNSLMFLNNKYKVDVLGYVFMPNHIHLLLIFDCGANLSSYMRDFKKFTSVQIRKFHEEAGNLDLVEKMRYENGNQKLKTWKDRFDDLSITSYNIFLTKLNYIHNNPVKKGLVKLPQEYEFSSAAFYESGKENGLKIRHFVEILGHPNIRK